MKLKACSSRLDLKTEEKEKEKNGSTIVQHTKSFTQLRQL
jgi:hypothetical protein